MTPQRDKIRLGFDLRALQCTHRGRGIGRYTSNLVYNLAATGEADLRLFYVEGLDGIKGDTALPGAQAVPLSLVAGKRGASVRFAANVLLGRAARKHETDVIFFPQGIGVEAACAIPQKLPCPAVVVVHDLIPLVFPEQYSHFVESPIYRGQCEALREAAAIIADSNCTKENICRLMGLPEDRVRVVYPGIDPIFKPSVDLSEFSRIWAEIKVSPPYFLDVGCYDSRKNLPNILRAFAAFRELMPSGHQLVLVEERDSCAAETAALIEKLGLEGKVVFTGVVTDEILRALYTGAQALVYPSLYEGFGLPALEAMACGTPVICSRAGSLPEVAGEAALYVQPEDPDELAAQMARLVQNPSVCHDLAARGKARAQLFRWEKSAREILAVCREAARSGASACARES